MTHQHDTDQGDALALSPAGLSPWNHSVELYNGRLALYWTENGVERIRTFTREETARLAAFLYDNKQSIFFPREEEEGTQ